jgi:hypothetical protein
MTANRTLLAAWLMYTAVSCLLPSVVSAQSLPSFFSSDAAAKVKQLNGQVSVLKDSTPWALSVGSTVQVRQVIVTGSDGFAVFEVSDGSTFEVYPNSRVTFRANPSNLKDLLDVWLGRVKVHIQKLGGQPNNNRVITPTAVISVRGTVFDVSVEDQDSTLVAVEEGLVEVQHAILPGKNTKLVNPGESLRVYRDQPLAQRSSPIKDSTLQQGMRAAVEALQRVIYRAPSAGSGAPLPGGGGGTGGGIPGGGAPADVDSDPPPPPPPPAPPPQE